MSGNTSINEKNTDHNQQEQFLTFAVGKEQYGVEILTVQEIKGWTEPTKLPNTPKYMRGVINIRGSVIPIFDLNVRLGEAETEVTEKHVVIVLDLDTATIGMLVDSVSDIFSIKLSEIKEAPKNSAKSDYVRGMISNENDMIILLDTNKLFSEEVIQEVTENCVEK